MARPIRTAEIFQGLPHCIVCGHPILKDAPCAQFTDGVACLRKRQGRSITCKRRAEGGERMIKGLSMPDDDHLPSTIKPASGDQLYAVEMAKQRSKGDAQDRD